MIAKLAWRNIWRNKRRTLLTLTSILFAVLLSCLMRSSQLGSYERMISNALSFYTGHVQVHKIGYWEEKSLDEGFQLTDSLYDVLETDKRIINIIPRIESFALASHDMQTKGAMVLGIEPEREDELTNLRKKLVEGDFLKNTDKAVMLAAGLAKYLKIGVDDSLVLIGQGYHGANAAGVYRVCGIVKFPIAEQNNRMVYLPIAQAQYLYAAEGMLTDFTLQLDNPEHAMDVVAKISPALKDMGMEALDWKVMMPELLQGIELDNVSGKIMLGILYMVIGFGMFGTFLMMTRERMHEFGLMMAMGMKKSRMQFMIFIEFVFLTTLGTISGILTSLPVLVYFYYNPIHIGGDNTDIFEKFGVEPIYLFSLDPTIFIDQAWIIFLMTLILAFYPLLVVMRMKLIKALRS
jgi:ABC-type lipoprotein release transport system permease subunit